MPTKKNSKTPARKKKSATPNANTSKPRYELTRAASSKMYHWRLIAANGKPIAESNNGYAKKSDAVRNINSHKDNVRKAVLRDLTIA